MRKALDFSVFTKQVGSIIVINILLAALGIVQVPIVTKSLGPSFYGMWSLINSSISLIVPFCMLSFSMSVIRFLAAEKDLNTIQDDFYSACSLVLFTGFILTLLSFVFSNFIATTLFRDTNAASFIRLSSILILLNSIFPIVLAFFRKGKEIATYNFLNLGLNVLQVGLIILFIKLGFGLKGIIIAFIVSLSVLNLIGFFFIAREIGFKFPRFNNMKVYLKWGIPLIPASLILWIISASDRYIINYFLGLSAAGIYNAAYGIGFYSSFALMPVGIVLYPNISRLYDEGNKIECAEYFTYAFKYLMMVTIPASVGLSILAKPLLQLLTTSDFISGTVIVPFIALGGIFFCFYQIGIYVIHLVGKTNINFNLLIMSAVLNIVLNIIFIPRFGILGSGLASLIAYAILGILTLVITDRYLRFNLNLLFIFKSLISSSVMAGVIWLIGPNSVTTVIISIFAGIITYFCILTLIRGFGREELNFLTSLIKKKE